MKMIIDFNAGRLATNCVMTGEVLLNGKPRRLNSGGPVSILVLHNLPTMDIKLFPCLRGKLGWKHNFENERI